MPATASVFNLTRQRVLADRATRANTFWTRFRGLLGRDGLGSGEGLVIEPCNSVHMFGMRFALDVLHLDRHGTVVRILPELRPGQVGPLVWRSHTVVELPAGTVEASGTQLGDQIRIEAAA